jgi:hypothetical protein
VLTRAPKASDTPNNVVVTRSISTLGNTSSLGRGRLPSPHLDGA